MAKAMIERPNEKKEEWPLVSLIVRTVHRPELPEALACIGSQTYNNIEIIVVDALGKNKLAINERYGKFPVQIISHNRHLSIPEAANAGLDAVKGDYFGFLDEDDLIDENHINDLFLSLKESDAVVAYSNIKMVDGNGKFLRNFDEEFCFERLLAGNFIPIHAMLIRSKILKLGCRPNNALKIFDDWDFLLQIAQHGKFVHINKTTGIYRNFCTSGVQHDTEMIKQNRKTVYAKWRDKLSDDAYFNFIDYLMKRDDKQHLCDEIELKWKEECQRNKQLTAELMQIKEELMRTMSDLNSIQASLSWKLTAPLRKMAMLFRS